MLVVSNSRSTENNISRLDNGYMHMIGIMIQIGKVKINFDIDIGFYVGTV